MNFILLVAFFLSLGTFIRRSNMAYVDVAWFFDIKNNNLSSITWAHAVNNRTLLNQALNSNVMMLEADVVIGALTGTNTTNIPIMAHPPAITSDLSLQSFLNEVFTFNQNATSSRVKKGVKLDFKSIEALETSTKYISYLYTNMSYPVWINADIISGPHNSNSTPVDANRFFTTARQFQNSTLSVGWTTNYGEGFNSTSYTNTQIENMLKKISSNSVNQSITFPVRAGIAAESLSQMQTLLTNTSRSTLTIWSSEGDPVNVTKLRELIKSVGLNKTFIDVPENLQKELNLQTIGSGSIFAPLIKLLTTVLIILYVF